MILLGIGANLPSETYGPPRATCGAALQMLENEDLSVTDRSPWYESAPVPVSDQPWYVNGVVAVATALPPADLMGRLLEVEARMGRRRTEPNAARIIDLDIVAYHDLVVELPLETAGTLLVPHPRMHERSFVIRPLHDISKTWSHPVDGRPIGELLAQLPADQETRRMADAGGLYGTEWTGAKP